MSPLGGKEVGLRPEDVWKYRFPLMRLKSRFSAVLRLQPSADKNICRTAENRGLNRIRGKVVLAWHCQRYPINALVAWADVDAGQLCTDVALTQPCRSCQQSANNFITKEDGQSADTQNAIEHKNLTEKLQIKRITSEVKDNSRFAYSASFF